MRKPTLIDRRLLALLPMGLGLLACYQTNSNYCPGALHNNCLNVDAAPPRCSSDQECSAPLAVCALGGSGPGVCVQCTATEAAACTDKAPVCSADNMCHACTAHAQCASNACLADGSCASETDVAYVAEGGSGSMCSKAAPCATLDQGLQRNTRYVKLTGLVKDTVTTTISGKAVTILADPGAKLDRDGDGAILQVQSNGPATGVEIFDLEVTGATGASGADGIQLSANGGTPTLNLTRVTIDGNQGNGISASGGALTVVRSTISGNPGGGISITNGTFTIVGNVFYNNGSDTTLAGGIGIGTAQNALNRLEFNTFYRNKTQDGQGAAIHCAAGNFTAKNNIMNDNGTLTNPEQVGGSCKHAYSIARPGTLPTGTNNSAMDPLFVDPAKGNVHIQPTSPARHAADPTSDLSGIASRDIDGDSRVSPADLGADQIP
jgi:hypothetical protein